MNKKNNLEIEINKDKYITTNIINSGTSGTTLALKQKDNKYIYSTLICKLYKKNNLNSKNKKIDKKIYEEIYKKDISPKLLQSIKINKEIKINQFINNSSYDNNIDIYEIAGFTTLLNYLMLSINLNLENYKDIINIIDITLNKIEILNKELNIIHRDLHLENIMIKNNYTIYLFNLLSLLNNENDKQKINKLNNIIHKIILNKDKDFKKYQDKELLNNGYKNINLTDNKLNIDINIIDYDFMINYKDIINFSKKYNLKDKKIKDVIELIMIMFYYNDKLFFIISFIEFLNNYKKNLIKSKKGYENFNIINKYLIKKYNDIINIISNINYLKNKDEFLIRYFIDIFLGIIRHYNNYNNELYIINQKIFDNIFNFIYNKEYLKDENKIFSQYLIINNLFS